MHKLNFLNIKYIKKAVFLFLFILIFLPKEKAFSTSPPCSSLFNRKIKKGFIREDFHIRRNRFLKKWNRRFTRSTSNNKIRAFVEGLSSFNEWELKEVIDIIRKTMGIIEDKDIPILSIPRGQIKNIVENPLFLDFLKKNIEDRHLFLLLRYSLMSLKWEQREQRENFELSPLLSFFVRNLTLFTEGQQEISLNITDIMVDIIMEQIIKERFQENIDSFSEILQRLNFIDEIFIILIKNEKLVFYDIGKDLFLINIKWGFTSLFKDNNQNVLDPVKLRAFLRYLSRFDVETQASLLREVLIKWAPEHQELMENPSILSLVKSFIKNKRLDLEVRKDLFLIMLEVIPLFFKDKDQNVLNLSELEESLRYLSRFDVGTQAYLLREGLIEWTPEQVRELMKNPSILRLVNSFIKNEDLDLEVRKDLSLIKWEAISLFKDNNQNMLDPVKLEAFLRDLNFFDVEVQAYLIRGVSRKWTPEQIQELMDLLDVLAHK